MDAGIHIETRTRNHTVGGTGKERDNARDSTGLAKSAQRRQAPLTIGIPNSAISCEPPAQVVSISLRPLRQSKGGGHLQAKADTTKLARFAQTVQSGMAIRAREGADRAELAAIAEVTLAGWDQITATIDNGIQDKT